MEVPTGTITFALVGASTGGESHAEVAHALAVSSKQADARSVRYSSHWAKRSLAFARAGDAAAAALDGVGDGVTIALHAGDLGGWHGTTVQQLANDTSGVLRHGGADSVVCSMPVRMLLGAASDLVFESVTDSCALVRRSTASGPDAPAVDHTSLGQRATTWLATRRITDMAGRVDELEVVSAAIERTSRLGASALVVVLGEAGSGKTRFAAEVAGRRADDGDLVVVGRCTESGGAFEPFLDALGDDVFGFEAGQLERDEEGWIDRRRFFGRITSLLADLARPVTLVLDDVQWIDGSSLALLEQLLDDLGDQLVVIAGCRPGIQSPALDELTGRPGTAVVSMGPLGRDDLASLAGSSGLHLRPETIDGVHALSAGNPFFARCSCSGILPTTPRTRSPTAPFRSAFASGSSNGSIDSATESEMHWARLRSSAGTSMSCCSPMFST